MDKEVIVLRYGHRAIRDERVTSHCCLVARAFGAKKIIIAGKRDKEVEKTLENVTSKWGGKFKIEYTDSWTKAFSALKSKGFTAVHLTMYGIPISRVEKKISKLNRVFVIVGSRKVERGVFEKSDYNVSITTQPHSEIAALAVALDRIFAGKEMGKVFYGAKIRIVPSKNQKIVRKTG